MRVFFIYGLAMNSSNNINFNFKQGIAWIVLALLIATPMMRFSWDIGPKTVITILTLASILIVLNTYKLTLNKYTLAYAFIFSLTIFISAIFKSNEPFFQSDSIIILDCIFLTFITSAISKYYKQSLLIVPILIGCILSIIALLRLFLITTQLDNYSTSLADVFINYNVIAGYLLLSLVLSFILWSRSRYYGTLITLLIYFGLLSTSSRSAIVIGSIAAIVVIYKLYFRCSKSISMLLLILAICVTSAAVVFLKPHLLSSLLNRVNWINTAISMFIKNPLSGVGWGNFGSLYTVFKTTPGLNSLYAHNIFFQILAESGLLGMLSFVLFIISYLRQIKPKDYTDEKALYFPILISLFAFLCFNLFDYGFYIPALTVLFFFLIGTTVNMSISPLHSSSTAKLFSIFIFIVLSFAVAMPLISSILYEHSKYYLIKNEYLIAQQYAERSILYSRNNWHAYTKLSEIHFKNYTLTKYPDELQDAIYNQGIAIKQLPANASLHSDLAWLYLSAGKRDQAIDEINRAISLDKFNDKYKKALQLFINDETHNGNHTTASVKHQ
jgi:O-antigen ligase